MPTNLHPLVPIVKSLIDPLEGWTEVHDTLLANQFEKVNSGCYKTVFRYIPDFRDVVVKVFFSTVKDCESPLPEPLRQFWLEPIYQEARFFLQPFADTTQRKIAHDLIQDVRRQANISNNHDLHYDNCAFYNGKPVIIDYC